MDSLKDALEKRTRKSAAPKGKIHSEAHALADEISTAFQERKRFAMYLGTIKRVGVPEARRIFAQLQQESKGHLGKLFMYLCSKAAKEKKVAEAKKQQP
jgi:rubrerythrin